MAVLLIGAILLAALTRPIDRVALPRDPSDIRPLLLTTHTGTDSCVRWARNSPLSDVEIKTFQQAIVDAGFYLDLHTVLPLMSAIRRENVEYASAHHGELPSEEFQRAALSRLGRYDRFRVESGHHQASDLLPALQKFDEAHRQERRDKMRTAAFLSTLPQSHKSSYRALVRTWHMRLATKQVQHQIIDAVANEVSRRRINALQQMLSDHYGRNNSYPANFNNLLKSSRAVTPAIVLRGIERDGSLRDGWLRPLEYFRVGRQGYRLRSQGADATSDDDDMVLSP